MQMSGFLPLWLRAWFDLHTRKTLFEKTFWPFYCLIIILGSIFDSREKAAIKAIDKPTAIHLQSKYTLCVSAV